MTRPATRAQRLILMAEYVLEAGAVPMQQLADHLQVSRMTAYRDVAELQSSGVVRLRRGMAVAGTSSFTETNHAFRSSLHVEAKAALCRAAARWLRSGSTVMLDDSTTVLDMVPIMAEMAPMTVITHSQSVAAEVAKHPQLRLFVVGGSYRRSFESCMGPATVSVLSQVTADVCLMSATAIQAGVCFHPLEESAQVKRMMMAQSDASFLLVHGAKFGHRATHRVADVSEFDHVLIAGEVDEDERRYLPKGRVTDVDLSQQD